MIDTIGLRSVPGEFVVSEHTPLEVYPARYSLSNGEVLNDFKLFELNGEEITGSKAILNRDKYQVTIDARGLYCQLSVPKYARGRNYMLSNKKEATEVLNDLEKSLQDEGIELDIMDAIPGRLDACKNVRLDYPTGNYFSFISSLGGNRMNAKSGYSQGVRRTGYQWTNSRQELVCYDKRIEMQFRKEATTGVPKNVLRFEHRLRNGRKIKEALGFNTVKDLLKNFGRIEENYNKTLAGSIFKYEADDKRLFVSRTIQEYLLYALVKYKRNKFQNFAFDIMFSKENLILDEKSLYEMLEEAMQLAGYKSGMKRIHRFRLKAVLQKVKEIPIDIETVSVRELYRELKNKVLKVA